jgi:hypothetical protein
MKKRNKIMERINLFKKSKKVAFLSKDKRIM